MSLTEVIVRRIKVGGVIDWDEMEQLCSPRVPGASTGVPSIVYVANYVWASTRITELPAPAAFFRMLVQGVSCGDSAEDPSDWAGVLGGGSGVRGCRWSGP
ncbi:hypothetical protein GCM10009646_65490 [Streptomyces aureus]